MTLAWEYIALANATLALCPPDKVMPFSPISSGRQLSKVSCNGGQTHLSYHPQLKSPGQALAHRREGRGDISLHHMLLVSQR